MILSTFDFPELVYLFDNERETKVVATAAILWMRTTNR